MKLVVKLAIFLVFLHLDSRLNKIKMSPGQCGSAG